MSDFRADLHCHSLCSDGSLSPEELVKLAVERGLSGLSITDHDSIAAYNSAIPIAKKLDLPLISGVEFSASHRGVGVHILGYAFPIHSSIIKNFCNRHTERRRERNREILIKLKERGITITEEEVYNFSGMDKEGTWGRPHIAHAMVKKGYVSDISDAFQRFIGEGKAAYATGKTISVEETLDIIHQAKGLAVIAHPMLIEKSRIVKELLSMPFDGLEAYYARLPFAQQKRWIRIAEEKKWLITGGSDFHGDAKPQITLGCSWVGEDVFNYLQEHSKQNSFLL